MLTWAVILFLLPELTKVWLLVIPFRTKFTPEWQRQVDTGHPATCAKHHATIGQHREGKKTLSSELKQIEASSSRRGGFLFKASWSGFIVRIFFFLPAPFDQPTLQQVLQSIERKERHWWVFEINVKKSVFLLPISVFVCVPLTSAQRKLISTLGLIFEVLLTLYLKKCSMWIMIVLS